MVIELNAIDIVGFDHFGNQVREKLLHLWVKWVEPALVATGEGLADLGQGSGGGDRGGAIAPFGDRQPVGMLADDLGIEGNHQAVFKPGNQSQVLALSLVPQSLEGILEWQGDPGVLGFASGFFDHIAGMERMALVPNGGVERVDMVFGKVGDGFIEAGAVVHQGSAQVGDPDATEFCLGAGGADDGGLPERNDDRKGEEGEGETFEPGVF